MRKFATLYFVPILSVALIALKQPVVENWVNGKNATSDENVTRVAILLALCTLLIHVFTVILPYRKHQQFEKNKWSMIDILQESFLGDKFMEKHKVAISVMVPVTKMHNKSEPHPVFENERQGAWFKKVFRVAWMSDGSTMNKKLLLTVKQGVSGMAFSQGKMFCKDITQESFEGLFLSKQQISLMPNLKFIISCPIYAFDSSANRMSKTKVIGVLNVSSSNTGAEVLVQNQGNRDYLTKKIERFSRVCGLIM